MTWRPLGKRWRGGGPTFTAGGCRGETAEVQGTPVQFSWLTRPVPVFLAAYGPRVLALAGEEADGLILQLASPTVVEWAVGHARRGAQAAGRTLGAFEIVAGAPTYISADRERALSRVRGFPATPPTSEVVVVDR